jgi:N-acetylglucosaminyl-diphospho-decaprenol L-rhamnosyltransferase
MAALVSFVIVTWNSGAVVLDCLRSLAEHPPVTPAEVVVVDNGSADGTGAAVAGAHPGRLSGTGIPLRVIANDANRGLPAANNQGIVAARGDALLICNPDTSFRPGAVDAMVATLDRHPRAAFVVPRLLYDDGRQQTSAGDLPTLGEALLGRQAQRHRSAGEPAGFWWDGWAHDEERAIGRGHEAAYLVRRAAIEEVGLQDEAYRLDWEGVDWTARMATAGWEVWLCPGAEVVHLGGASIRQAPFRWIASSHRGMYRYFSRRSPAAARPALAVAIGARALVKSAAAVAKLASYERGHG